MALERPGASRDGLGPNFPPTSPPSWPSLGGISGTFGNIFRLVGRCFFVYLFVPLAGPILIGFWDQNKKGNEFQN